MTNVQQTLSSCWEQLSLLERRKFLTFECSQLCVALCDARDKSIELFHEHLASIAEFAETMCWEMERRQKQDDLQKSFTLLHEEISKDGFTQHVAERLEALSEDVKNFILEDPNDEDLDADEQHAYDNVVAAMKADEAKVDALSA